LSQRRSWLCSRPPARERPPQSKRTALRHPRSSPRRTPEDPSTARSDHVCPATTFRRWSSHRAAGPSGRRFASTESISPPRAGRTGRDPPRCSSRSTGRARRPDVIWCATSIERHASVRTARSPGTSKSPPGDGATRTPTTHLEGPGFGQDRTASAWLVRRASLERSGSPRLERPLKPVAASRLRGWNECRWRLRARDIGRFRREMTVVEDG